MNNQAMRLYKAVERLALQAGEDTDEAIDWLCGEHGGMFKLYEAYFSPKPTQRNPLSDEELISVYESEQQGRFGDHVRGLRAVEQSSFRR